MTLRWVKLEYRYQVHWTPPTDPAYLIARVLTGHLVAVKGRKNIGKTKEMKVRQHRWDFRVATLHDSDVAPNVGSAPQRAQGPALSPPPSKPLICFFIAETPERK